MVHAAFQLEQGYDFDGVFDWVKGHRGKHLRKTNGSFHTACANYQGLGDPMARKSGTMS
jgi:hypothetical protein